MILNDAEKMEFGFSLGLLTFTGLLIIALSYILPQYALYIDKTLLFFMGLVITVASVGMFLYYRFEFTYEEYDERDFPDDLEV